MWWCLLGMAFAQSRTPDPFFADDLGGGGAIRADPIAVGASLTAPAVMALQPNYTLIASGRLGTDRVRRYGAGAIDSQTGPVALGAVFIRETANRDATTEELPGWLLPDDDIQNPQENTIIGGGLATSFAERRFAVGAGMRYHRFSSRFSDPTDTYQAHASIAGRVRENIFLSASAEDLLPVDQVFAPKAALAARAASKEGSDLSVETIADFDDGLSVSEVRAGGQLMLGIFVPIRAGYRHVLATSQDIVTAGIGVGTDEGIFNYGFSYDIDNNEQLHALSLRIFF
ncbi:MAG: hypothetical protein AAFV53_07150 [Myxococcota bacterium]